MGGATRQRLRAEHLAPECREPRTRASHVRGRTTRAPPSLLKPAAPLHRGPRSALASPYAVFSHAS